MRVKCLSVLLGLTTLLSAEFDYRVQNSNFTISQGSLNPASDKSYLYNYDRLRFRIDYSYDAFFATIIADGVNYYGSEYITSLDFKYLKLQKSDTPFKTQSKFSSYDNTTAALKLYRAYGGYEDDNNRVIIGLQNISLGVGRIWTPTNLFNPKNIYALESDETFGIFGVSYTRHIDDTSKIMLVASQKEDSSFKYAFQYRSYLDFADFAFDIVISDNVKMIGYELEANFAETGVEVRSEGSYIKSSLRSENIEFFQGVLGLDYAFVNGITLVAEALYSSEDFSYAEIVLNYDSEILPNLVYSKLYTALSLSYSFDIYLDGSLLYIESFNDKNSRYIAPTLTYTLDDYNSFILGAMLQNGESGSEFGEGENSYYFKWLLSF